MYDPANLTPIDPTNLTCALTWVRYFLRDTGPDPQYVDAELTAALMLGALRDNGTIPATLYYRPHALAASLLTGEVGGLSKYRLGDLEETYRDPSGVAAAILAQGAAWDDLIPALIRPAGMLRRVDIVPGVPRRRQSETF